MDDEPMLALNLYEGTDWEIPAHITDKHDSMVSVRSLFAHVSVVGKHGLYAFAVRVARQSEGVIRTKGTSGGIVNDLCEMLNSIPGMQVRALICKDTKSWVLVDGDTEGPHAFIDMEEVPPTSPLFLGLTGFFSRNRMFLNNFEQPVPKVTPLVCCFEYVIPLSQMGVQAGDLFYIGPRESFIDESIVLPKGDPFPWVRLIDTCSSSPILHNIVDAIVKYALSMPMEQLIANAKRFFLMQKPNEAIALVLFVSNEYIWLPIGGTQIPAIEDQFTMMINHAIQYNTSSDEVVRKLLIFYARWDMMQTMGAQIIESDECYLWLTTPNLEEGDSLTSVIRRERQAQESQCYLLKTKDNTILPLIWTARVRVYRGLVTTDSHPAFGSAPAFRVYVETNFMNMLKLTAATADTHELMRLVNLWDFVSSFVVKEVHTYMARCSWIAYKVFLAIINMYEGVDGEIELSTFLTYMHSMGPSTNVCEDIVIMQDLVLFLTMPTESQCLAAKAFHAVVEVDPVQTANQISNDAFQLFLSVTDESEQEAWHGQVVDPQETAEGVDVTFPDDVHSADKATLLLLLRSRGLAHLLAHSPLVPAHQSWVGAISMEDDIDIFELASKALLVGMTRDLVVLVFDNKLRVTIVNRSTDNVVGLTLLRAVVNAYNTLISNHAFGMTNIKYNSQDVVMLFRVFNVGYRERKPGHEVINRSLLCEAIVNVLFDIYTARTPYLGAVWSDAVDFLLSGAISHRANIDWDNDNECGMTVDDAGTGSDVLNTMKAAVRTLYLDRVQAIEVVSGSMYFFHGTISSAFMVAPHALKNHDHLIRNVELRGAHVDAATVGVLASLVVMSLYGGFGTVQNLVKLYDTIISRYQLSNPIPFIVRQILQALWSEHQHYLHFPDVKHDSQMLISTWERNIANESLPFYRTVLSVIQDGGSLKGSGIVVFDDTVSFVVQGGVGSKERATVTILITDWPLIKTWEAYIDDVETVVSALNVYKGGAESHPVSSLLCFGETVGRLIVKDKQNAMQILLSKGLALFLESVSGLLQQITNETTASRDAVVNVLDKVVVDDSVSLVTNEGMCGLRLLPQKSQNSVLALFSYPFALLDQSIALHYDSVSRLVDLTGTIDSDLMLITNALMDEQCDMAWDISEILNPAVSDWLLACMQTIAVEKRRSAILLCLNSMVEGVQPFWCGNREVFERSVIGALQQLPSGMVTRDSRRKFLRDLFTPLLEIVNMQPDVGACVLLVPSSLCDYNIVCMDRMVHVSPLDRWDKKNMATDLTEWLNSTKDILLNTSVDSPIEDFMEKARKMGANPIQGDAAAHVFSSIPAYIYTHHSLDKLMGTVIRASVLNAWTRDIPAIEIYTRKNLVAAGQELIANDGIVNSH